MPDAYDIHDAQFIQYRTSAAGAASLFTYIGPVPAGKVWTILAAFGNSDVNETQVYWFAILGKDGINYPITMPASVTVDPANRFYPCLTEGMEIKLYPGESLYVRRFAATAGSAIYIYARLIETDLQYYVELDKAKVLRRRQAAMTESEPATRGGMGPRFGMRGPLGGRERPTRY